MIVFPSQGLQVEEYEASRFCLSNLYRQTTFVRGPKHANSKVGTIMRKVSVGIRKLNDDVRESMSF
jgi:hypothetical protein